MIPEHGDAARQLPLVVALDGTLIRSDLLIESLLLLAKHAPLRLLASIPWLAKGRAYFKHRLAQEIAPDASALPYNQDLIAYLRTEKQLGRELILASGDDERLARDVAAYVGLFDRILASDGWTNLSGEPKRDKLVAEFGFHGFDYVGNGHGDRVTCAAARKVILAWPEQESPAHVEKEMQIERIFEKPTARMEIYLKALRPHQWLKNVLVFAPLAIDYQLFEPVFLVQAVFAFVAFSLCASSGYLLNDLMDLPSDRHHPRKKDRPLASGQLPLMHGIALMVALLLGGIVVGLLLPRPFLVALAGYYALTLTYSFRLKDVVILDVLTLAILYTVRVVGGALAVSIPPSSWLLAFCIFLFFSLALIKRYAELVTMRGVDGAGAHARAYLNDDRELLASLGGASGFLAVLVLALYIGTRSSPEFVSFYQLFWLDCMLLLYWVSYMWLMAHRGQMDDDPLVFTARDGVCRTLFLLMAAIYVVATLS